jgi:hypothetical protein
MIWLLPHHLFTLSRQQSVCASPVELTDGRGGCAGVAQRRQECLVLYKSFNTLCPELCLKGWLESLCAGQTGSYATFATRFTLIETPSGKLTLPLKNPLKKDPEMGKKLHLYVKKASFVIGACGRSPVHNAVLYFDNWSNWTKRFTDIVRWPFAVTTSKGKKIL